MRLILSNPRMTNNSLANLSPQQLRRAAEVKERIEALQRELGRIVGATLTTPPSAAGAAQKRGGMSAAARARIAAAQRARWAKQKGKGATGKTIAAKSTAAKSTGTKQSGSSLSGRGKPKFSPEVRARIAAALRERWAKAKASGKKSL